MRWNSTIRGRPLARSVESWSWWIGFGGGDEERVPAGLGEPLGEVALVVVDEELGVHVADRHRRLAADQQRARLRPVDPAGRAALALHGEAAVQEERPRERRPDPGEAPGAGHRLTGGVEQLRRRRGGFGVGVERRRSAPRSPPVAARSPRSAAGSSGPAPRASGSSRSPPCRSAAPARSGGSRRRAPAPPSAEPSSEALSRTRISRSTPAGWVRSIAARQASRYSRPFVFTTQ